jgi:hypothetical protein
LDISTRLKNFAPEQLDAAEVELRAVLARDDSPEGYFSYYRVIFGKHIPEHAKEWIYKLYEAREKKMGIAIEAFRGATKTTVLTIGFISFFIGLYPHKANLIIQFSDDKAGDSTNAIASIIADNGGWKKIFPHVVPDRDMGWSAKGYEVMRDDMDRGKWRELNAKRKDPTLKGVGYTSSMITGSHPDGVLDMDDILDENNTRSQREMEGVRKIIKSNILHCLTGDDTSGTTKAPETILMLCFTPWREDDPMMEQVKSGTYITVVTPALRYDENGKDEYLGKKVTLTWKKKYSAAYLEKERQRTSDLEFARAMFVDLTKAGDKLFYFVSYPAVGISLNWPMAGGVDYASVRSAADTGRDYFAMCYLAKRPEGGGVVVGGVLERCTQGAAEDYVQRAQEMFYNWRNAYVEKDGKGEDFALGTILRHPGIRLHPIGTGGKSKDSRYNLMAPFLESGMIAISDAKSAFLDELRYELDNYVGDKSLPHDDALDALYWAIRAMPDATNSADKDESHNALYNTSIKKKNPWLSLLGAK